MACSGTGAMESSFANCFCAGDTVIVARNGKFGDRMVQLAQTYGLVVVDLKYEWTEIVRPRRHRGGAEGQPRGARRRRRAVRDVLRRAQRRRGHRRRSSPAIRTASSSSTRSPGIGAVPCMTDEWGLDVVMTGSQKGLMLPPGLAALTVSEKAWRAYERSTLPKYYFDWMKYKKNLDKETTPVHPAGLAHRRARRGASHDARGGHRERHRAARAAGRGHPQGLRGARHDAVRAARGARQRRHPRVGARGRRRQEDRQDHEEQVRRHDRRAARTTTRAASSASGTWATSASSTSSRRSPRSR